MLCYIQGSWEQIVKVFKAWLNQFREIPIKTKCSSQKSMQGERRGLKWSNYKTFGSHCVIIIIMELIWQAWTSTPGLFFPRLTSAKVEILFCHDDNFHIIPSGSSFPQHVTLSLQTFLRSFPLISFNLGLFLFLSSQNIYCMREISWCVIMVIVWLQWWSGRKGLDMDWGKLGFNIGFACVWFGYCILLHLMISK